MRAINHLLEQIKSGALHYDDKSPYPLLDQAYAELDDIRATLDSAATPTYEKQYTAAIAVLMYYSGKSKAHWEHEVELMMDALAQAATVEDQAEEE